MNLILFTVFVCVELVYGQSSCETPNGENGECIPLLDCKPLMDLIEKKNRTNEDMDLVRKSRCKSQDEMSVCCPKKELKIPCKTPEGYSGICTHLCLCPHLRDMLNLPLTNKSIDYARESLCNGTSQFSACCGFSFQNHCNVVMSAYPPDPRSECCGVDGSRGNKLAGYGGLATELDEHPWTVIIEYEIKKDGGTRLLCGGALISGKYVLTAAHCVAGRILDKYIPRIVRLGEFNITNEGPDCAEAGPGEVYCTDGVTRIAIEETIPHPRYNPVDPNKKNDIGLIRLKETVHYSDFIRPICLPTKDWTRPENAPRPHEMLHGVGWGAVSDSQPYSEIKQKVLVPFVEKKTCQPAYNTNGRHITLSRTQLCAGGKEGVDTCKGDSGGPLTYVNNKTIELIGIISFGPVPCALDGVPGIYSNVYKYLDWIKNVIVP